MNNVHSALPETVRQLLARVRRHLQSALDTRGLNMSPPEAHILYLIQAQPAISPLEIATQAGCDKAFVARKIKAMEEAGWIVREKDEQDQRRCKLHLTPAGQQCCQQIEDARREAHSAVFHPLSPDEQELLNALMQKCLNAADTAG